MQYVLTLIIMNCTEIRRYITLVFSLSLLLLANIVQGQEIALVPSDPAVKSGVLPNGMKWYVAENSDIQGVADFALVQMTGTETIQSVDGSTVESIAKESLSSQPLLTAPSVQDYFISKGSIPGPEGFAEVRSDATVFRFSGINMKASPDVLDSTLLVLMNMAGRSFRSDDLVLKKWYTPSDHAVIVAGDVNAGVVADKLRMLSFMIPSSEPVPRKGYVWRENSEVITEICRSQVPGIARVSAVWRLERTPRNLMNTVQPAIQEKYMTMAGLVARERLLKHFRNAGIPVASVDAVYEGGSGTLGDSRFSVAVTLSDDRIKEALTALAGTVASIDSNGISADEAERAAREFKSMIASGIHSRYTGNRQYINRCVSAFIYNTPLSSGKEIKKFHESRELSPEMESSLVHSVASASLDPDKNLALGCSSDTAAISSDSLKYIFASAWNNATGQVKAASGPMPVPHLPFPEGKKGKVRIKSMKKEYLSGGSVWTLSNGMTVVFRNMPEEDGNIHYSLSLNGGTGNVDGLGMEDGGYLSDYLFNSKIGGVSGECFCEAVRHRGMTMSCQVRQSSTRISGVVPADDVGYMLRALLAVMNDRTACEEDWKYYLEGESLRQAAGTASGDSACLGEDFADKAEAFFNRLSENVNNGVLILVGKIDEKALKSALTMYAGEFRTTDKSFTRAGTMSGKFSGIDAHRRKGAGQSVEVLLTAPMALTAENHYTAAMTSMVLRRHFAKELAEKGMRVWVGYECRRFPQESVLMRVSVRESSVDGLASGTSRYSISDALSVMKDVFSDLSAIPMDPEILNSYRVLLEKQLSKEKQTPAYWVDALNLRYLEGKDFTTGAESKIKGITEQKIRALLATLEENSRIEYVITGK